MVKAFEMLANDRENLGREASGGLGLRARIRYSRKILASQFENYSHFRNRNLPNHNSKNFVPRKSCFSAGSQLMHLKPTSRTKLLQSLIPIITNHKVLLVHYIIFTIFASRKQRFTIEKKTFE